MRQVSARREVEAHDAFVGLEEGGVGGKIRRRARVRLHVDTPLLGIQPKGFKRTLLAKALEPVDMFVAAVVARAWEAFGVLVSHARSERLAHRGRREILRRDQLDAVALALRLRLDDPKDVRVLRL